MTGPAARARQLVGDLADRVAGAGAIAAERVAAHSARILVIAVLVSVLVGLLLGVSMGRRMT